MIFLKFISSALLLRVTNVFGGSIMTSNCGNLSRNMTKYLNQAEAAALDQDLFTVYKFSVDQLMELAGLSVASAVLHTYPSDKHKSILVVCGPGNNGGDGLVAARHLVLFGYNVGIYYPKRTEKPLYENLLEQCRRFDVKVHDELPDFKEYQVIVDALFGFSFKPPVRKELEPALNILIDGGLPVCSVDIPSGWHVENGPISDRYVNPALLISLSAPKLCARSFCGVHYLGGRFLPPGIIKKYDLTLPKYPSNEQVVLFC